MLASSEKCLLALMTNLSDITVKYGMRINVTKTKVMMIKYIQGKKVKIVMNGQGMEEVDQVVCF